MTNKNKAEIVLEPYQKRALKKLQVNKSFCLFFEQGTGKTITALKHLEYLFKNDLINNALVIAPKSALGAWARDIDKLEFNNYNIDFINYELISTRGYDKQFDCIILDEGHAIKSRTSKRSCAIHALAMKAKYKYILTGTPITNGHWEDLYSLFTFLFPVKKKFARLYTCSLFKGNYDDFLEKYTYRKSIGFGNQKIIVGYKNIHELQIYLDLYSSRVEKEKVLNLPFKHKEKVLKGIVRQDVREVLETLEKTGAYHRYNVLAENSLALLSKLRTASSGHITNVFNKSIQLHTKKKTLLKTAITSLIGEKIVIFAEFVKSINDITEVLNNFNISYVVLDGRQKDKNIWRLFQENDSIKVIVCQYRSGAAGIELNKANHMIFYEPTLSSTVYEQAKDRIHRRGQVKDCFYYCLCLANSIEEDIYNALFNYETYNKKIFEERLQSSKRTTLLNKKGA